MGSMDVGVCVCCCLEESRTTHGRMTSPAAGEDGIHPVFGCPKQCLNPQVRELQTVGADDRRRTMNHDERRALRRDSVEEHSLSAGFTLGDDRMLDDPGAS